MAGDGPHRYAQGVRRSGADRARDAQGEIQIPAVCSSSTAAEAAEKANAAPVGAELARALAAAANDRSLITLLKLEIEELRRAIYGPRSGDSKKKKRCDSGEGLVGPLSPPAGGRAKKVPTQCALTHLLARNPCHRLNTRALLLLWIVGPHGVTIAVSPLITRVAVIAVRIAWILAVARMILAAIAIGVARILTTIATVAVARILATIAVAIARVTAVAGAVPIGVARTIRVSVVGR
jgi:hypothetical protein